MTHASTARPLTGSTLQTVRAAATPVRHERRRPGRPTLLDGGVEVLLSAIRAGNRLSVAARLAGIAPSTVEGWVRRGKGLDARPATPTYTRFVEDLEQAQAEAEEAALAAIRDAMGRDWKAAAWFLETTSEEWRRRRLPPSEPPPDPEPERRPTGRTIMLSADMLEAIAHDLIRREQGWGPERDEEVRLAYAALVTDTIG